MIGKQILHYKILQELGRGGMGVVYKAEDAKLKREVAIKFLPRQIAASDDERERFKIEAQAAAALNHPNIATIYAIEEVDEEMFIVMEYIEGQELKNLAEVSNLRKVMDIATQIASGLQAAHAKGITHRDIKSSNIMVTESGQVKIMDFGLAKITGGAQLTKDHSTLGTAAYMSPEQARGETVDHRADIWSFGVVLYEMLTGHLPFPGDYEQAVIYSILNEEPEPLTALRSGLPIALDGIVAKALAKDPATRYQRVDELSADLKGINTDSLSNSRISTKQPKVATHFESAGQARTILRRAGGPTSESSTETPPLLGKRTVLVAALLVAVGIGLSAGWLLKRGAQTASAPGDTPAADETSRQSLAVLPFVALSSGEDDGYFADGLTEEIINSLAALPKLLVTARTSSFHFKGKDVPVDQIAAQLGVAHIVEGSVRRAGDKVRVTAQLIRAADGFHLWSDTYDAQLEDVFQIQTDVAEKVAGALSVYLDEDQREAIAASGTRNVEAFKAFLKGRALLNRAHASEPDVYLWDANEEFERAMALDPKYVAPAIAHHDAFAHYLMDGPNSRYLRNSRGRAPASEEEARAGLLADLDRAIDNARTPTVRIVAQLNKEFFSATWARMPGLMGQLREKGAIEEVAAIEIWLTVILALNGEFEMVRRLANYNVRTNPLHAGTWSQRAALLSALGEFDAAEEAIERGRATAGDHPWLHDDELSLAIARRDRDKVLTLLRSPAPILTPEDRDWRAAYLAAVEGDYRRARELADEIDAQSPWPQEQLLRVHHETGDAARARALTKRIDDLAAGPAILARSIAITQSMLFFDIADTPNFAARLEEAGIDPASFRPMPRLSVAAEEEK